LAHIVTGTMARRLKHWGWGYEDEQPSLADLAAAAAGIRAHLGFGAEEPEAPVPLSEVSLAAPRLAAPFEFATSDPYERALHSYGRAYRDIVRAFRGVFDHPPDVVARPRTEEELERVLEWALGAGALVVPFGGGTSVVGGVEPREAARFEGVVTIELRALDRVLEIDETSRAARIQAGATGPGLEAQLAERGMTMRHYPQSFQFSTLGGWIATRAGGHFATLMTHVDDLVESVRALTPAGWWESRRLPGSGAGVSPDRMLLGSEGTLGLISEAWVRIRPRPEHRAGATVRFASFEAGAEGARALAQSDLYPANARLIDPLEAGVTGAGDGEHALLLVAFESADHPVDPWLERALQICREAGGEVAELRGSGGSAATWRETFIRAPYLRDTFIALGVISDTFETAITWERFPEFHAGVMETAGAAIAEACGAPPDGPGSPRLSCRFTHVYPDGPAPYYTVLCPARRGGEVEQWDEVKAAVSERVIDAGGTITHHHAVGRDHRPWYDRQRPGPFAEALRAAKRAIDPEGVLNPGVLLDP
jgi:alkyldihydroxyacetonephosphate synthase